MDFPYPSVISSGEDRCLLCKVLGVSYGLWCPSWLENKYIYEMYKKKEDVSKYLSKQKWYIESWVSHVKKKKEKNNSRKEKNECPSRNRIGLMVVVITTRNPGNNSFCHLISNKLVSWRYGTLTETVEYTNDSLVVYPSYMLHLWTLFPN